MNKLLFLLLSIFTVQAMEKKVDFESWLKLPTELKALILTNLPLDFSSLSLVSKEFDALVHIPEFQKDLAQAIIKSNPHQAKKLLFKLIKLGQIPLVKAFIKAGYDSNSVDAHGMTPLMSAVKSGHVGMVKLLLKWGAQVNGINNRGDTALILTTREDNTEIADLLWAHHADLTIRDPFGSTLLIIAIENRSINMVKWLLDHGACVNGRNSNTGKTALDLAQEYNQQPIIKLLEQAAQNKY